MKWEKGWDRFWWWQSPRDNRVYCGTVRASKNADLAKMNGHFCLQMENFAIRNVPIKDNFFKVNVSFWGNVVGGSHSTKV